MQDLTVDVFIGLTPFGFCIFSETNTIIVTIAEIYTLVHHHLLIFILEEL